jgi:hypothetical protein
LTPRNAAGRNIMRNIIYLVGLVVVVMAVINLAF